MGREVLGKCPVCGQHTEVTTISCNECGTKIEGHFELCKFCRLTAEQKSFIETFVRCRGSIREVERELGISYPTVKNRLEDAANALGYQSQTDPQYEEPETPVNRAEILTRLESGDLTVEEALALMKE